MNRELLKREEIKRELLDSAVLYLAATVVVLLSFPIIYYAA